MTIHLLLGFWNCFGLGWVVDGGGVLVLASECGVRSCDFTLMKLDL